jgi:hypothetical protein
MISDDDLLLYHYRELDAPDRARIGAALSEQPELAQRLQRLVSRLDAAAATPEVPVPAQVQQRWQAALEAAQRGETRTAPAMRQRFVQPQWLAAAATLAVVALVVGLREFNEQPPAVTAANPPPAATGSTAAEDATAYENGLKFHLASTERQLASLGETSPEERARLVETIISQNRMYALAAERAGEPQLARVLRAFGPVLESAAGGDDQATADSVAQLSFELRVMQARLGADAKTSSSIL